MSRATTDDDAGRTAAPGRRPSVRTVLLGWVIGLTAVGMLVASAVSWVVQVGGVRDRVDAALEQEVEEFRQFARTGVDPETGASFTTVDRLLAVALQRNVPDTHETFLALVDGEVRYVPPVERVPRLERAPDFVAELAAVSTDAQVVVAGADVDGRSIRYAAIPVRVDGATASGLYVVAYDLDAERADVDALLRTSAVVDVLSLLLVALVGGFVAGRLLRPVRLLRETAQRISDTGLDQRIPVTGNDELSDLARTFNEMLDRLEQAFAAQRQFMDDAGHELRTPVTILRGHLELLDPSDPVDVEATRALLLDELDRTSRLVDDLALLAKVRRPDFTQPAPVELAALVRGAHDKATALGRRRWLLDELSDQVVRVDAQRIEQALLQLAANAVRHTRPGGEIAMGCSASGGLARLWVRDDGEGIAPEDHERVFERFGRVSSGRGDDGSGLGLAIVSAIAESAGGRVRLESARDAGARFTLELPLDDGASGRRTEPLPLGGEREGSRA